MTRKILLLTQGHTNPHTAKTASSVIRYRPEEAVALLDNTQAGKTSGDLLGVGDKPVVSTFDEAPGCDTLLIGIAPPGGSIPKEWRPIVLEAMARGMNVVSGLHDFFTDDAEFSAAAAKHGVELTDVRKNNVRCIALRQGLDESTLRIHTVGHDCSIGKMTAALEIEAGLRRRGHDSQFIATGQTGIMVSGAGLPIDCVTADFISGATESLILENQKHKILVVEGQGSLVHPAYSGVTLGLLHGCSPHGLIFCYEYGRTEVAGYPGRKLPPVPEFIKICESMANQMQPSQTIGVVINARTASDDELERERDAMQSATGLPVVDVFRNGVEELVDAVEKLQQSRS
ncbi:DUF1611 domain-containing protein [Lignipirellula cremea]|uniref:DUF1611 domain-containing protein n=1 Tax=Lignipirellula cremea TaxID=2528010 RepID=A0A518DUU9_9BACT|nr:DUF1611 domain-containing protein [Lignipirellula cremea]QDU95609.1 hypothetical protein Pla8534_34250 [Lignipirellula cremea]